LKAMVRSLELGFTDLLGLNPYDPPSCFAVLLTKNGGDPWSFLIWMEAFECS